MKSDGFTRYWIELQEETGFGYGVTALDKNDALGLLQERVFRGGELPPIRRIESDVDVSQLDPNHVLPNAGPPIWRGVWFPNMGPEPR
jgi:hypothetical protein